MCSSKGAGAPTLRQLVQKSIRLWIGLSSVHCGRPGSMANALSAIVSWTSAMRSVLALRSGTSDGRPKWSKSWLRELATLMGLDRPKSFRVEHEDCDLLIAIDPHPENDQSCEDGRAPGARRPRRANGGACQSARSTTDLPLAGDQSGEPGDTWKRCEYSGRCPNYPPLAEPPKLKLQYYSEQAQRSALRSQVHDERRHFLSHAGLPAYASNRTLDVWTYLPRLHLIFFIHRVEGLELGLYALPATRRPRMPCKRPSVRFPLAEGR